MSMAPAFRHSIYFLLFIFVFCQCEKEEFEAFEIVAITASPDLVGPNENTVLYCDIGTANDKRIDFNWYAQKGSFPEGSTGSSVTWKAPEEPGVFKIYVIVTSGEQALSGSIILNKLSFIDPRDGREYTAVTIGNQVWMAQNLAYLPGVSPPETESATEALYYVYDTQGNSVEEAQAHGHYAKYGVLYNWEAAQYACPEGWYLPTFADWLELESYIEANTPPAELVGWRGNGVVGKQLKSESGWLNKQGDDRYGFGAQPAGMKRNGGEFQYMREYAYFWTSAVFANSQGIDWRLSSGNDGILYYKIGRTAGLSVRCLKEFRLSNSPPEADFSVDPADGNVNTIFEFDASGSTDQDSDSASLSVRWDWTDDGVWDTEFLTEKTIKYQYLDPGPYTVRLEVRDDRGLTGQKTLELAVPEGHSGDGFIVDARDGQTYDYVIIGDQTWLTKNMAYLPTIDYSYYSSVEEEMYYVYGYTGNRVDDAKKLENYKRFGVLYNWPAALTACPEGWHLPSDQDWIKLRMDQGLDSVSAYSINWVPNDHLGTKLRAEFGWAGDRNGTDDFRFTALPAGYSLDGDDFRGLEWVAQFWTSSGGGPYFRAWRYQLSGDRSGVERYWSDMDHGLSVRCIKDME